MMAGSSSVIARPRTTEQNVGRVTLTPAPVQFPNYPQAPREIYNGEGGIGYTKTGSNRQDLQATSAAEGSPIRVTYGRDNIGADVVDLFVTSAGNLAIVCVWGERAFAIRGLRLGNQAWNGIQRDYTNNALTDDPLLAAERPFYSSAFTGLCFTVIEVAPDDEIESLDISVVIDGRPLADPRIVGTNITGNAALILSAFSTEYLGTSTDQTDLETCADFNDDVLDTLAGDYHDDRGRRRVQIGITFDKITDKARVFATLRDLAQVYTAFDGEVLRMTPNRDDASVGTIGPSQIVPGSAGKKIGSLSKSPNAVTVVYTDAQNGDNGDWIDAIYATPYPVSGPIREQVVRIPAIQSRAHAARVAIQRVNFYTTTKLSGEFDTRDESIKYLAGSLVDFTDTEGATAKKIRILDATVKGKGLWRISWIEHDPAAYSNDYVTEPSVPDSDLPSPFVFPDPIAPDEIREVLFTDQNRLTFTRFEIRWTGSDWQFIQGYRIQISAGSVVVMDTTEAHQGAGVEHLVATPATSQGVVYTVKIWLINAYNRQAPTFGSDTKTGNGKTIPPTNPSNLTGREANQMVALSWGSSVDSDLRGYQIRRLEQSLYEAAANDAARWDHASAVTVIKRIDSTRAAIEGQPVGAQVYMVKAEDHAGNYSAGFASKLVLVTEDQSGVSVSYEAGFDELTSTNFYQWNNRVNAGVNGGDYVTVGGETEWESEWPTAATEWATGFGASDRWSKNSGAGFLYSDFWDTGEDKAGNWSVSVREMINANGTYFHYTIGELVLEANYPPGSSEFFISGNGNGIGRYFRGYVAPEYPGGPELPLSAAGFDITIKLPFDFTFHGIRVFDSGSESVPGAGSQPLAVLFNKTFSLPPVVKTQLLGSVAGFANPDNVTTTGFDLYVWDTDGLEVAGSVDWTADGV